MSLHPFSIRVSQDVLEDLSGRLERTRWPGPPPAPGWAYGLNQEYLRDFCSYWCHGYDWRSWENRINALPQFKATIDGVAIHFLHVTSGRPGSLPLIMMHGWPGSIVEFLDLIGPLTAPDSAEGSQDSFDLIIPSLPGFGFSGHPQEPGWGAGRMARAFDTLIRDVLGYEHYVIQGGDIGAVIGIQMARAHPNHVLAMHLNYVPVDPPPLEQMNEDDREALAWRNDFVARHTSHRNVQSSVPDSLTMAQTDSPAGLAAWILSKMNVLCEGGIETAIDRDKLVTNLMFYWLPASIASAARVYAEMRNDPLTLGGRVEVPTGVAAFPIDTWKAPRHWVEPHYNVVHWSDLPRGGHFPALEEPDLFLQDVRAFFRRFR